MRYRSLAKDCWKANNVPAEKTLDRRRHTQSLLHLADAQSSVAQGNVRGKVERHGDRWEQASVVDGQRSGIGLTLGNREE